MRRAHWMLVVLLISCAACSSSLIDKAEGVHLDYWAGNEKEEYIDENNGLDLVVNAISTAEQSVITTQPLVSLAFLIDAGESRNYHLWITQEGEGYIQSLHPQKSRTFQLDDRAAESLKAFFAEQECIDILQSEILFEQ